MRKWQDWYDSLPENTKAYLDKQAIWSDKDVVLFVGIALVVGFVLGKIL